MADSWEILILIPARGGSKRLPRKNILPLAGKPLICWTIDAALHSKLNARIMVTSDDEEILTIARQYESENVIAHKRNVDLASDSANTADVLVDAVNVYRNTGGDPKVVILLQPTSPLRTAEDIQATFQIYMKYGCEDTAVSVCEVDYPTAWVGNVTMDSVFTVAQVAGKRSQDYEKECRLNGAVYVVSVEMLMRRSSVFSDRLRAWIMPRDRSFDIDEELDFKLCESLIETR